MDRWGPTLTLRVQCDRKSLIQGQMGCDGLKSSSLTSVLMMMVLKAALRGFLNLPGESLLCGEL